MWQSISSNYILFLLVLTRMSGVFLFNPFFGRKNVPTALKIGLAIFLAVLLTPAIEASPRMGSQIEFVLAVIKELFIGFVTGFVVNLFVSWVMAAGEASDIQLGLGMAKIYDPQANVSMPVTGTLYNIMLTLMFFAVNGHLTLIKIAALSLRAFPPGFVTINAEIGGYLTLLFGNILVLAVKLAAPVIAIELLTEAGMGVLMRTVPQINVFVASIQLKVIIGLVTIIFVLPAVSVIFGNSIGYMFERLEDSLILTLKS